MKKNKIEFVKNGEELNLLSSTYFTQEVDRLTNAEAQAIKAGLVSICKKDYSETGGTIQCGCGYAA